MKKLGLKISFSSNEAPFLLTAFFFVLAVLLLVYAFFGKAILEVLFHSKNLAFLNQLLKVSGPKNFIFYYPKIYFFVLHLALFFFGLPVLFFLFFNKEREKPAKKTWLSSPGIVLAVFLILALIIRLRYFFYSVIDWDESTFIIMGQDILNGHLPYVHLWDNKPPLAFVFYALFILFFGKSVAAVRLGGLLMVVASAFITREIGRMIYNETTGFWAGVLLVIFSTTLGSSGAVMTEHLALLPLSLLLFFMFIRKNSFSEVFCCGFFLAWASLIKPNLLFLGLVVGPVLILRFLKLGPKEALKKMGFFLTGFFLLPLAIAVLYFANKNLEILIKSTIYVPLAYKTRYFHGFIQSSCNFTSQFFKSCLSFNFFLWAAFGAGVILIFSRGNRPQEKKDTALILAFLLAGVFSIIETGIFFGHYLILLVPFLVLPAAVSTVRFSQSKIRSLRLFLAAVLMFSLIIVIWHWYAFLKNIYNHKSLFSDTGYKIVEYLKKNKVAGQYIFELSGHHIVYWLCDARLPTKYVQSTNLYKTFLLKAIDGPEASWEKELQKILDKKPQFILVWADREKILDYFSEAFLKMLYDEIAQNYQLANKIDNVLIWKRK